MNCKQLTASRGLTGRLLLWCSLVVLVLTMASAESASAQISTWQINTPESAVQFTARHMMVTTIGGGFSKFSGTIQYDPKDVTKTTIQATIDTASENSGVEGRDKDVQS